MPFNCQSERDSYSDFSFLMNISITSNLLLNASALGSRSQRPLEDTTMLTLRKASERGAANHGWLKSFHTFSFANYWNPNEQGFPTCW